MTVIEFFDGNHIENVYAYFYIVPEKVILLGNSVKKMDKICRRYEAVFAERDIHVKFEAKSLPSDLSKAVSVLSEIIEQDEDYIFDITGGADVALTALGIVYERYTQKGKKIQLHRYNFNNAKLYDCDGDNEIAFDYEKPLNLSVDHNIRIFGGDVIYDASDKETYTYLWDMNEEFEKDVETMWKICFNKPYAWNLQMDTFEQIVKNSTFDGLVYTAKKTDVTDALAEEDKSFQNNQGIIGSLKSKELITVYEDDGETVTVGFKNEQVMRCLSKAGQVLEMKVYKELKNYKGADGEPLFNDVMNGVQIDWDGNLEEEGEWGDTGTKNEVDVIAMNNAKPLFVSCKNGKFDANELYKLKTVAERFGGTYAKMMLVATKIPSNKYKSFMQRAIDMNIEVIELSVQLPSNVKGVSRDRMYDEHFKGELKKAFKKFELK